jgi:DNA replication protein DnaC
MSMPEELCPICEGAGLRVVERADGTRVAQPCACRTERGWGRAFDRARIPKKFIDCTLEDYVPNYSGNNPTLNAAILQARNFVKAYPHETYGKGLMLVGEIGTGKTHLAVAILKALITERGAKALFYDCATLLDDLKNTYERKVDVTEREMLMPIYEADVLLLDELGAAKVTDWGSDTIARVINARYNDSRTTIVTTNLPNLPPIGITERDNFAPMRRETLGDRIGERMRSRLQEMCVVVEMAGKDFRQSKPGRASFAHRKYTAAELFALGATEENKGKAEENLPSPIPASEEKMSSVETDKNGGKLRLKSEKKETVRSSQVSNSLLNPDKVWTQEDIDREVELKTRLRESKLPLD